MRDYVTKPILMVCKPLWDAQCAQMMAALKKLIGIHDAPLVTYMPAYGSSSHPCGQAGPWRERKTLGIYCEYLDCYIRDCPSNCIRKVSRCVARRVL